MGPTETPPSPMDVCAPCMEVFSLALGPREQKEPTRAIQPVSGRLAPDATAPVTSLCSLSCPHVPDCLTHSPSPPYKFMSSEHYY